MSLSSLGFGQAVVVGRFAVPGDVDLAFPLGFVEGHLAPRAGDDVVGGFTLAAHQIQRDHRELQARAALQKDNLVVVRDGEQLFEERFGGGEDFEKARGPVAHFQHAHAVAGEADQLALGLLQHRQRQDGRAGGEIEDAVGGGEGRGHARKFR